MLGRHVYRVTPLDDSGWRVLKDGEVEARGRHATREAAARHAWELAGADEPSKVVIGERNGAVGDERLFGADAAVDLAERDPPPRK